MAPIVWVYSLTSEKTGLPVPIELFDVMLLIVFDWDDGCCLDASMETGIVDCE